MGAWDILAQVASVDDTSSATNGDVDRKMTGVGVNYNFSKTTRAYIRYDDINFATNAATAAGTQQTRTAVGVSKSF
jgi:predicted porin